MLYVLIIKTDLSHYFTKKKKDESFALKVGKKLF